MLALLYMADRVSLEKAGRPIVGGNLSAMDYGPIHSEVYDLIKGGHSGQAAWARHFSNESPNLRLAHDPGVAALSRFETRILSELSDKFLGYDDWDVAEETHEFSEYVSAYSGKKKTSVPIRLENLIDAVGRGSDKEKILRDVQEKIFFDQIFSQQP